MNDIRCFGRGALVPDCDSTTHAYMLSAPGCWEQYSSVLARRGDLARVTAERVVDAYAVQHAADQ